MKVIIHGLSKEQAETMVRQWPDHFEAVRPRPLWHRLWWPVIVALLLVGAGVTAKHNDDGEDVLHVTVTIPCGFGLCR